MKKFLLPPIRLFFTPIATLMRAARLAVSGFTFRLNTLGLLAVASNCVARYSPIRDLANSPMKWTLNTTVRESMPEIGVAGVIRDEYYETQVGYFWGEIDAEEQRYFRWTHPKPDRHKLNPLREDAIHKRHLT